MNEFVFYFPKRALESKLAKRAFLARRGRIPIATTVVVEPFSETRFALRVSPTRFDPERGRAFSFYAPCVDRRDGLFFASTETLIPNRCGRPRPLFLELARGQLSRLLKRRWDRTFFGVKTPSQAKSRIKREIARFAELATSDRDRPEFDAECVATFERLRAEARRLNEYYLDRSLDARRSGIGIPTARLGFSARPSDETFEAFSKAFCGGAVGAESLRRWKRDATFQTFNPTLDWATLEPKEGVYDWRTLDAAIAWADVFELRTTFGPLIRWDRAAIPRWLLGRANENDEITAAFRRFVDALLVRDAGRTKRWIVATNVEKDGFGPPSEDRLRLAEETACRIARAVPDAESFLGFEQPLVDAALFRRQAGRAPLEVAGKIARRGFFSGFYLEMNFGTSRRATVPRDPLEWGRFWDQWASFGVRLCVATSTPSAAPNGSERTVFASSLAETTLERFGIRIGNKVRFAVDEGLLADDSNDGGLEEDCWDERTQQENSRRFLQTALARRSIDEIIWSRLQDVETVSTGAPFDAYSDDDDEETAFDLADEPPLDAPEFVLRVDATGGVRRTPNGGERVDAPENAPPPVDEFSRSGLIGLDGKAKSAYYKLAALRRAYLD